MNQTFLYTLILTGFGVAFLHAAIPTHWLPFVAVGRARGWSHRRILASVALAGGGHVIATTVLGVGLAWFGFELNERFDQADRKSTRLNSSHANISYAVFCLKK